MINIDSIFVCFWYYNFVSWFVLKNLVFVFVCTLFLLFWQMFGLFLSSVTCFLSFVFKYLLCGYIVSSPLILLYNLFCACMMIFVTSYFVKWWRCYMKFKWMRVISHHNIVTLLIMFCGQIKRVLYSAWWPWLVIKWMKIHWYHSTYYELKSWNYFGKLLQRSSFLQLQF